MNLRIYVYLTDTSTDVWPSSSCCLLTLAVVLPTPVATLQWERSRVQCQVYTSKEEGFYKARRVLDPYNTREKTPTGGRPTTSPGPGQRW